MKYFLTSCLLFLMCGNINASEHAYGGIPSGNAYIERQGYLIQFDSARKTPK